MLHIPFIELLGVASTVSNSQHHYDRMLEELRDPDKVYAAFIRVGQYSVELPKRLKPNLVKLFRRNNRKLFLERRSRGSLFYRYILFAYVFSVDIVLDMFSPKDKGYLVVQFFTAFHWPYIKGFRGEDVDEQTMRVTFYPRA